MGFADAIRSVLTQYAVFTGRARRSEYWYWVLFGVILGVVVEIVDAVIGNIVPSLVLTLALLIPNLAVGARRLHDTGRSGWWLLIALIPIVGVILLIVWFCGDSKPGSNVYGPSPKGAGPQSGAYGQVSPPPYGQPS